MSITYWQWQCYKMKTNKSIPMTKLITLPWMNYCCPCFGEVECGWNFILCELGSEQKNCILFGKKLRIFIEKKTFIFLVRSEEYFLKRKLLSRLVDSIHSKGETSGGNRDMLSGATKSLISSSHRNTSRYIWKYFCSGFTMHTLKLIEYHILLNLFS